MLPACSPRSPKHLERPAGSTSPRPACALHQLASRCKGTSRPPPKKTIPPGTLSCPALVATSTTPFLAYTAGSGSSELGGRRRGAPRQQPSRAPLPKPFARSECVRGCSVGDAKTALGLALCVLHYQKMAPSHHTSSPHPSSRCGSGRSLQPFIRCADVVTVPVASWVLGPCMTSQPGLAGKGNPLGVPNSHPPTPLVAAGNKTCVVAVTVQAGGQSASTSASVTYLVRQGRGLRHPPIAAHCTQPQPGIAACASRHACISRPRHL
jgi:hypothetical protein